MYRDGGDAALARATAAYEQLEVAEREDETVPTAQLSSEDLLALAKRYEARLRRRGAGELAPRLGQPVRRFSLRDVIPWRSYVIETSLWPFEVRELFRSLLAEQLVLGAEKHDGFKFSRRIQYRNSFLPVVQVTIEPASDRTLVRVRMRLMLPVAAFMAVWMFMTLGAAVVGLVGVLRGELGAAVALGFPLFGAGLCTAGFATEARKMDKLLYGVLPAPENE